MFVKPFLLRPPQLPSLQIFERLLHVLLAHITQNGKLKGTSSLGSPSQAIATEHDSVVNTIKITLFEASQRI